MLTRERKIITSIIDSLIKQAHETAKLPVHLSIKMKHNDIEITIHNSKYDQPLLDKLNRLFNQPKHSYLEEYYGELVGQGSRESNLILIGMLSDNANVTTTDTDTIITISHTNTAS